MKILGKKYEAIFIERLNRFVAKVRVKNEIIDVHVPNSGRLKELLTPGARVLLRGSPNTARKYKYDLIMAYKNRELVSVDSLLPNKLIFEVLAKGKKDLIDVLGLEKLTSYEQVKPEIRFGNSRFDLGLGENNKIQYYVEVKGVTLVENGMAYFPDAPTERGTKHLEKLVKAKQEGFGAGVIFVIQRRDAECFCPHDRMDPAFGKALRQAASNGVDIFSFKCHVKPDEINLIDSVKVLL